MIYLNECKVCTGHWDDFDHYKEIECPFIDIIYDEEHFDDREYLYEEYYDNPY